MLLPESEEWLFALQVLAALLPTVVELFASTVPDPLAVPELLLRDDVVLDEDEDRRGKIGGEATLVLPSASLFACDPVNDELLVLLT